MAAKNSEEKSKKAMVDAARLADELRAEQDHATTQASAKNSLSSQLGDLEGRLADAEAAAMRGGKAAMAKLEMRIRELEAELGSVQGRTSEAMKGYQRAERKVKELQFSQDEDKKNQDRMSDLANKLQERSRPTSNRLRRLRRLLLLTLPNSARPSRNLKRLRREQRWLMPESRLLACAR